MVPLLLLLLYWYSLNRTEVAGFLLEAKTGISEALQRPPDPWYRHVHYLLANKLLWGLILALFFTVWLGREFYRIGTNILSPEPAADGEPFFWFEGVSIWPSVMLRALAGLLALYFLLRGSIVCAGMMWTSPRNSLPITRKPFSITPGRAWGNVCGIAWCARASGVFA